MQENVHFLHTCYKRLISKEKLDMKNTLALTTNSKSQMLHNKKHSRQYFVKFRQYETGQEKQKKSSVQWSFRKILRS